MATAVRTPSDLVITPRNRMFGRNEHPARWWHGGNPAPTAFYNALSLTFPKGEGFFIESVRHYRDEVSAPLAAQIGAFITQESVHSREHLVFNRQVHEAGYDARQIEAHMDARLAEGKNDLPLVNLMATVALEHFTAILAHAFLEDDRYFEGAPSEVQRLWKWHSIEEIEHKGVAYDTFLEVTASFPAFTRWKIRSLVMLMVTRNFISDRIRDMAILFQQDGINSVKTWARAAKYLLVYPGLLRRIAPAWLTFFKPGFHPWMHDDRALLRAAEQTLGLAPANP
jgi:predicted metal-dependent hydrolase